VRVLVVLVLVSAMGFHWGLLQTVAWTTMLVGFAKDRSLDEAVAMTFDSQHPCGLCSAIREAQQDQPGDPAPAVQRQELPKAVLPTLPPALPRSAPLDDEQWISDRFALIGRQPEPPTPPPRRG